jgi:DNA-binding MarR family transcriptional regulator
VYRCINISRQQYVRLAEFRYQLRRFLHISQEAAERAAVHPQQHQLLLVLAGRPKDAEVTVTTAAERMFLRHNSAVELVDRCVDQGLIARHEDGADRRRSLLRLTTRGEELLQLLAPYHLRELEEFGPKLIEALSGIAPRDRSTGGARTDGMSGVRTERMRAGEEALSRARRRKKHDTESGAEFE